jgi:membrane protease YdiL (CAAX protease family)
MKWPESNSEQIMNVELPHGLQQMIIGWNELRSKGVRSLPLKLVASVYLAGISIAEVLTTFSTPQVGLVLHALLFMLMLAHAALLIKRKEQIFLFSLSLAPLIRLMSLSMPLASFPFVYWYAIVGAPLFLATFVAIRLAKLNPGQLGLNFGSIPLQLLIGVSGIALGLAEFFLLRPTPLIQNLHIKNLWLPALILLVFTGFLEELIFRGLMQWAAIHSLGRFGFVFVSLIFAALHIGYQSLPDVFFVFLAAIYFAYVVKRTGSLFGVSLAHGLTNITLFLILPFIFGASGAG